MCTTVFTDNGECLFSNISKDKNLINEFYYNLEYKLRNKGKSLSIKKSPIEMIEDQTYVQYIMNNELRCLLGSINEFFMPEDLFMEIAQRVFGNNPKLLHELKKINIFLNNPVTLTFKERERHMANLQKMLSEDNHVEIRLIDGQFIEDIPTDNPSFYLSKNLKFIKVHPVSGKNDYSILRERRIKKLSDSLFEQLWNYAGDLILIDKDDILDRISKSISYTKIISKSLGEDIH